jgi:hypothetical protein
LPHARHVVAACSKSTDPPRHRRALAPSRRSRQEISQKKPTAKEATPTARRATLSVARQPRRFGAVRG